MCLKQYLRLMFQTNVEPPIAFLALSLFNSSKLKIFIGFNLSVSFVFDEDTGESEILPGMGFWNYYRPIMILVDNDFCQST